MERMGMGIEREINEGMATRWCGCGYVYPPLPARTLPIAVVERGSELCHP
jgi:hypothetical protein